MVLTENSDVGVGHPVYPIVCLDQGIDAFFNPCLLGQLVELTRDGIAHFLSLVLREEANGLENERSVVEQEEVGKSDLLCAHLDPEKPRFAAMTLADGTGPTRELVQR